LNGGRGWRPAKTPARIRVHDLVIPGVAGGKAIPWAFTISIAMKAGGGRWDTRDAKAAPARHPRPLRQVDHLSVQLLDDRWTQAARALENRRRVRHAARIDPRERAIHQIGADLLLQIVVAPIEQMPERVISAWGAALRGFVPRASSPLVYHEQ